MRLALVALLLVGRSVAAHAMGPDVDYRLVAWNKTGTAALLERVSSLDGESSRSYVIISTTTTTEPDVDVSQTISAIQRFDGQEDEQVDVDDCRSVVNALAVQLTALHFNSVVIRSERCKVAVRDVVRAPSTRQPAASRNKVERAAEELVIPGYQEPSGQNDCNDAPARLAVARRTRRMVLVFETNLCDSPTRTSVHAIVPHGAEYALGPSVN